MRLIGSLRGSRNPSCVGAWAVIQAGGTGKLHSHYNIASYTDGGTGIHLLTFLVPFASASNYAVVCGQDSAANRTATYQDEENRPTANSVQVVTIDAANNLVDQDPTTVICVGRQ